MPGLDRALLETCDHDLAVRRVVTDVRSDFILAPHISAVFAHASTELWEDVHHSLSAGTYEPGLPITIDVPKPSGLTRPGSILLPADRLVYQLLIDMIHPTADNELDRQQVFSHQPLRPDPDGLMFAAPEHSWRAYQNRVTELCRSHEYVVRADVASYFERLNQHYLVNLLESVGCPRSAVKLLEKALLAFTEKDSYGILQGVFPSDYLGTFYLHGLDSHLEMLDIPFSRYTDDLFVFFDSQKEARRGLAQVCRILRHEGLHLNESKTRIATSEAILYEETELDRMFAEAREEVENQFALVDWYNMQITWQYDYDPGSDDEPVPDLEDNPFVNEGVPGSENGAEFDVSVGEEEGSQPVDEIASDENIELSATEALLERVTGDFELSDRQRFKIERFVLPALAAARSDSAVEYCATRFFEQPHMAQIYSSYLSALAREETEVAELLASLSERDASAYDWQQLWLLGGVLATTAGDVPATTAQAAFRILSDGARDPALRAVCALVVGKHGSAGVRRLLRHRYADEPSEYVRGAVLYSARYFPSSERRTAVSAWSGHSPLNTYIGRAVQTLSQAS